MERPTVRGGILLITDVADETLLRTLVATDRHVETFACAEASRTEHGAGDDLDLVVLSFDRFEQALADPLLGEELFPGVPRLHVCRDPGACDELVLGWRVDPERVLLLPDQGQELHARARLLAEVGSLRRELRAISLRDPLTGLHNRRYLVQRIDEEFSRARRYRTPLSLVLLDIDQLKRINDAGGQSAGDSAIRSVSELIRAHIRKEDVLGRMGEESYAVLLPGNRYRGAAVLANKIRTGVERLLVPFQGETLRVLVSAGISTVPDNPAIASADDLMRATEDALEEAKSRGGNRVFIDEGALDRERRLILVADPDVELLDLAEDLLSVDDYRVVRAESARSALETLRFRRPDLLILDLGLAESEPGVDLLGRASELNAGKRLPIVGLSRGDGADPERLQRQGIDRFITKPFSISVLRSVVRELMESRGRAR